MSQLGVILQESFNGGRETRKILALLREKMDGVDGIRRRSLKERLGLKSMNCCGATCCFRPNTVNLSNSQDEEQQPQEQEINTAPDRCENVSGRSCVGRVPLSPGGMNLAAALAAERHFRAADGRNVASPNVANMGPPVTAPETPLKVSLMRLLAETDASYGEEKAGGVGNDKLCCVCMGRKKGAAFIPCGHTFCRVCSREMWLNRGSCPLCNRSILEILDIF